GAIGLSLAGQAGQEMGHRRPAGRVGAQHLVEERPQGHQGGVETGAKDQPRTRQGLLDHRHRQQLPKTQVRLPQDLPPDPCQGGPAAPAATPSAAGLSRPPWLAGIAFADVSLVSRVLPAPLANRPSVVTLSHRGPPCQCVLVCFHVIGKEACFSLSPCNCVSYGLGKCHSPLYTLYTDEPAWVQFERLWPLILANIHAAKVDYLVGGNS